MCARVYGLHFVFFNNLKKLYLQSICTMLKYFIYSNQSNKKQHFPICSMCENTIFIKQVAN